MKKVVSILLSIMVIVALFSNTVFAVEDAKFGIGLTANKISVNPGDEITVTLRVKDFQNVQEGIYSFLATIDYDKQFFETLTESSVKGLGSWSSVPTFNPENGLITADSGSGVKIESDVFVITFKIKSGVQIGTSTTVTVKDFEGSEGEYDIQASAPATVTINVVEKSTDADNNNNNENSNDNGSNGADNNNNNENSNDNGSNGADNNNNNDNSNGNGSNGADNNNNNDNSNDNGSSNNSTSNGKLPQTGENSWIIVLMSGISIFMAFMGYFGYKKYREI